MMVRNVSVSQSPQVSPSLQPLMSPLTYHQGIENKISPSILLIIIILAVIFFISGLLHLIVRFLLKPSQSDPDDLDNVTVLQGQLQQLFHLHDSGVDQSFIDTLPVFLYKAIIGLKNPFDCAVCLCEFEEEDRLRFLPKCSHAFHVECIDTWLLSHSTCPICRGSLLPDFSPNCSPVVLVLESGSESSREIVTDRDGGTQMGFHGEDELGSSRIDVPGEMAVGFAKEDVITEPKLVPVKLGKFRNVDFSGESSGNANARRCFSMGSFEYVLDGSSVLHVAIAPPMTNQGSKSKNKKPNLPLTPGHRSAMSECDFSKDSSSCKNGFKGFETRIGETNSYGEEASIQKSKTESFSISKIWLRSKKGEKSTESSRRAFSFRLPVHKGDEMKVMQSSSRMSISETEIATWDGCSNMCSYPRSEFGIEEEEEQGGFNFNSIESHSRTPSFARRTLNWFLGRQKNKVVHSSPTDVV